MCVCVGLCLVCVCVREREELRSLFGTESTNWGGGQNHYVVFSKKKGLCPADWKKSKQESKREERGDSTEPNGLFRAHSLLILERKTNCPFGNRQAALDTPKWRNLHKSLPRQRTNWNQRKGEEAKVRPPAAKKTRGPEAQNQRQ